MGDFARICSNRRDEVLKLCELFCRSLLPTVGGAPPPPWVCKSILVYNSALSNECKVGARPMGQGSSSAADVCMRIAVKGVCRRCKPRGCYPFMHESRFVEREL